jgi:transaldolase
MHSRLHAMLVEYGQSVWLDQIDRGLLRDGGLAALVAQGVRGVTTNPTIFERAVAATDRYDEAVRELIQADHEIGGRALCDWLVLQDVQMAADILRPVYESSDGEDGYVSVELDPAIARDSGAAVAAARSLARTVARPNVMIKVPGTPEGLQAFEKLTAEGVNVNVTLLFSLRRYEAVTAAYLRGLERHEEPARVASVASFFLSRIDTRVDAELERIGGERAAAFRGHAAIACAKRAYRHYCDCFYGAPFERYRQRGARPQRLLWASTGTKNPGERDTRYVEALIGPGTVSTLPLTTLEAFLHHGRVGPSLRSGVRTAERELRALRDLGIDLEAVAAELEEEGIARFRASHDALVRRLEDKRSMVARTYASG